MKKANFTTTPFYSIVSKAALMLLMVCSGFALQAQCGMTYYDTGGASAPYNDGVVQTLEVCPDNGMLQYVRIVFNQYDVAAGDVLEIYDGLGSGAPLLVSTSGGSSVANAPGGGWVDASPCGVDQDGDGTLDDLSGCLTVVFTPNGDNTKGAGFTFTAECNSKGFNFPDEGDTDRFTEVISLGEFCRVSGVTFPLNPPVYSDCSGGDLIVSSDCIDAVITPTTITLPVGTTTVTYTSPLYPSKQYSAVYLVLPPTLACNDDINVSLLNECTIALTPDLILEDPCEAATVFGGLSVADYDVFFTDPNVVIVGTTLAGFPVADFSGVPCGTRLDVKVTRTVNTNCGENFEDVCWGQIVIEDKVAPILEQDIDEDLIPCFYAGEDFLDRLNGLPQDGRQLTLTLAPLRVTGNSTMYNQTLVIEDVSDVFPVFDNCSVYDDFRDYDVSAWQEVDFDCTTGGFDLVQSADDPLWDLMAIEFGPAALFRCYFRTVTAIDDCGNVSEIGLQRVCVAQPDIVAPLPTIELPCGTDIDPVALYNFWAADPDWRKEYACFIPAYDPTPLNLNGDFGLFAGLDDTYYTDCSGDEVPAYPDHADCGYAIDWDDSDQIETCTNSYKVFREWTVFNWCDGHLEIIDVIPQVIKVGDTRDPELTFLGLSGTGSPYYDCAADAIISVSYRDDCSGDVRAYVAFNGAVEQEAEFDITSGSIRVPNVTIGDALVFTIRLIDDCGNSTTFGPFAGTLGDNIPPIAICESFRTVSVGRECEVIVPAEVFDDGSYDNCGTVSFSVVRMDDLGDFNFDENFDFFFEGTEPLFQPTITFTQEDLTEGCDGSVRVVFRVEDGNGNSNFCMVDVTLQDKLPPTIGSRKLDLNCDSPDADDFIQAALSDDSNSAVQDLLNTSGVFSDPSSALYIRFDDDNCDNSIFLVDQVDASDFDATCRQGTFTIFYQATDACGNVSFPGIIDLCINPRSDWKMNFPMDAEVFCEDNVGLPAAATVDDILVNNGCDFWGLEVSEETFEASAGACFKVIREYHLINWCAWNPNNTEIAVVERPSELILDPFYTVALRYRDANNDGLNDIDDGNEDADRDTDIYGNQTDEIYIYKSRDDIYNTFAPISIPFTTSPGGGQLGRINDQDEAEDCDPYDVTTSAIDGDWVVIDYNDLPYDINGDIVTTTARSQFSNTEVRYVSAQEYGNIVYRQIIKVNDVTAPTVDVTQSGPFCGGYEDPGDDGTCTGDVNVKFSVSDLCSDNLQVTYTLEAFTDADFDNPAATFSQASDGFGDLNADGGDYSITGTYPIGRHVFVVTVSDRCSNVEIIEIPFEVNDCKAPVAYCIFGLAADLMGPGSNGAAGMVTLWASEFDAGSFDYCSDVTLTFADPNLYPDSTARTFRCADGEIGVVQVELWVQDAAGNTSFCETFVNVQANPQNNGEEDICPRPSGASIAGEIETETAETVEGVEVNLSGNTSATAMTGANGTYTFTGLELEYDYTVTPHNDDNPLNGVSTFDLVLISKHILSVELLDSPYKLLAADVNNSGSITTFDMVQLRKVILGIDSNFPGNTSWRFIPADYDFSDPSNPFDADFNEFMTMNDLDASYLEADFVAVKVGDVNGTATPNATVGAEGRNMNGTFALNAADADLSKGEETTVEFTADLATMAGYQFTMNFDGLEIVKVLEGEATTANFGIFDNAVTASWNDVASTNVAFTLVVRATKEVTLSKAMTISSSITSAEAYTTSGEFQAVALNFSKAGYALGQNRPNPFKGETLIQITMPSAQKASLKVHDVTGRVLTVITQDFEAGYNELKLNSKDLQAGVLYYTLEAEDFTVTKKMIILE